MLELYLQDNISKNYYYFKFHKYFNLLLFIIIKSLIYSIDSLKIFLNKQQYYYHHPIQYLQFIKYSFIFTKIFKYYLHLV